MARHGIRVTVAAVSALVLAGLVTPVAVASESAPNVPIAANVASQSSEQTANKQPSTKTRGAQSGSNTETNAASGNAVTDSSDAGKQSTNRTENQSGTGDSGTAVSNSSASNSAASDSTTTSESTSSSDSTKSDSTVSRSTAGGKSANTADTNGSAARAGQKNASSSATDGSSTGKESSTDPDPYTVEQAKRTIGRSYISNLFLQPDGTYHIGDPIAGGVANHSPSTALNKYYAQKIQQIDSWEFKDYQQKNGAIIAPIDYDHPEAGNIALFVYIAEPKGGQSKGVIAFNPGGPGGDASGFAASVAQSVDSNPNYGFLKGYTLVGVTPRGVNYSIPFSECNSPTYSDFDTTGKSYAENFDVVKQTASNVDAKKKYANQCFAYTGLALGWNETTRTNFLKHIGTTDSAKDLDLLRSIMGQDKLNYIGVSYGSKLGYEYLREFGSNVGKFAIDGIMNPQEETAPSANQKTPVLTDEQLRTLNAHYIDQGRGYQDTFEQFAKWCYQQTDCPLSLPSVQPHEGDYADDNANISLATKQVQNILRPLLRTSYRLSDSYDGKARFMTFSDATIALRGAMYEQMSWPILKEGLYDLATGVEQSPNVYAFRDLKYRYNEFDSSAFITIGCADNANPSAANADNGRRVNLMYYAVAPMTDPGAPYNQVGSIDSCDAWHFDGSFPMGMDLPDLPNVLVVSTTHDPATPYENGPIVAKMIRGSLLTVEGARHIAFDATDPGYECVARAYDNFFNHDAVDKDGTVDGICSYRDYRNVPTVETGSSTEQPTTEKPADAHQPTNTQPSGTAVNTSTNAGKSTTTVVANGAKGSQTVQAAKGAKTSKTAKAVPEGTKLAVTGTNIENALLLMVTVALFGVVLLLSTKRNSLAVAFQSMRGRSVVAHHAKE